MEGSWERTAPDRLARLQAAALTRYIAGEVHPLSPSQRARLDAAGLGAEIRDLGTYARLPPIAPADVDGLDAVLRPAADGLRRSHLRRRWLRARLSLRRGRFVDEVVEPRYRPIHFDDHGSMVVAATGDDLDRLAELGRRWLEHAGLTPADAVVALLPASADLAFWQFVLGAQRGGVPTLHLGPAATPAAVAAYGPTVVVGRTAELLAIAEGAVAAGVALDDVRAVLAVGDPADPAFARLGASFVAAGAASVDVVPAWAPPGVRALWSGCVAPTGAIVAGAAARGLHTWPDAELIEVVTPGAAEPAAAGRAGELVWSPIGWAGTAVLRLRTGVEGRLVNDPCPACGRTTPRVVPAGGLSDEATLAAALGSIAGLGAWVAERRVPGGGLVVRLAPATGERRALEASLDDVHERCAAALGADAIDRVMVERPSVVRRRLEAGGGAHVIDLS